MYNYFDFNITSHNHKIQWTFYDSCQQPRYPILSCISHIHHILMHVNRTFLIYNQTTTRRHIYKHGWIWPCLHIKMMRTTGLALTFGVNTQCSEAIMFYTCNSMIVMTDMYQRGATWPLPRAVLKLWCVGWQTSCVLGVAWTQWRRDEHERAMGSYSLDFLTGGSAYDCDYNSRIVQNFADSLTNSLNLLSQSNSGKFALKLLNFVT